MKALSRWRWVLLPSLLLAACSPPAAAPTAVGQAPTLAPAVVSTTLPTAAPTEAEPTSTGAELVATEEGGIASQPAPSAAPTEPTTPPPTVTPFVISEDFTPSDPATVNLAAGQPQLVEFFAFW